MRKIFTYTLIILFSVTNAQTNKEITEIVEKYRVKYNIPAIATSVIRIDSIYYGISGFKNIDNCDKIDLNSKFHLGSNTKAITSMLAAKLVESGELKWNTKLLDIVTELKGKIKSDYNNTTLEDLLSHRSMIHPFEDDNSKEWRKMPEDLIRSAKNQRLAFASYALNLKPVQNEETNHVYSNGGYIIAGLIFEKKTGKTWEELVSKLFEEINIDHYVGFPSQKDKSDTFGHVKKGKKYKIVPSNKEYALDNYFAPAGNLSLSILGFSKLIQLHLKGLFGSDNILRAATYSKLHFGLEKYALGWYNGEIGDSNQKFSYHGGSLGTYSSAVIVSSDREIAIIILINADNDSVNKLKNELRVELWDKYGIKN